MVAPFLAALLFVAVSAQNDPIPQKQVEAFEISLDQEPETRWAHVVTSKRAAIVRLANQTRKSTVKSDGSDGSASVGFNRAAHRPFP